MKNEQLFVCPSRSGAGWVYDADPATAWPNPDYYFGYGMNYWMTWYYYYSATYKTELAGFPNPAGTIWFTDCNHYVVYPTFYLATYPADPTYGQNGTARLQNRHNNGANVGFLDGHAKWMTDSALEGDNGPILSTSMWWGGRAMP